MLLEQEKNADIFRFIGESIQKSDTKLLSSVKSYAISQIPQNDAKKLPLHVKSGNAEAIGKTTFNLLHRIAWKTFCKSDSPIFKLWSKKVPEVFDTGYFTAAFISVLNDFRIGAPLIASGVLAIAMKYSAEEFCKLATPKEIVKVSSK